MTELRLIKKKWFWYWSIGTEKALFISMKLYDKSCSNHFPYFVIISPWFYWLFYLRDRIGKGKVIIDSKREGIGIRIGILIIYDRIIIKRMINIYNGNIITKKMNILLAKWIWNYNRTYSTDIRWRIPKSYGASNGIVSIEGYIKLYKIGIISIRDIKNGIIMINEINKKEKIDIEIKRKENMKFKEYKIISKEMEQIDIYNSSIIFSNNRCYEWRLMIIDATRIWDTYIGSTRYTSFMINRVRCIIEPRYNFENKITFKGPFFFQLFNLVFPKKERNPRLSYPLFIINFKLLYPFVRERKCMRFIYILNFTYSFYLGYIRYDAPLILLYKENNIYIENDMNNMINFEMIIISN